MVMKKEEVEVSCIKMAFVICALQHITPIISDEIKQDEIGKICSMYINMRKIRTQF
jgi:hypothetical protein